MRFARLGTRLTILGALFALAACSGGTQDAALPGAVAPSERGIAHHGRARLVLHVRVPRRKHRRGHYVSPATAGITIAIAGPTNLNDTAGLTVASNAQGCTSSLAGTFCTLAIPGLAPCPSTSNCYSATIATYDNVSCGGSGCTIPPGANELSANQNVGFTVAAGQNNQLGITLDGIPQSVVLVADASSTLVGNASGYTLSKCVTTPQNVDVLGEDAGGNFILGPGAPAPSLASDDSTHLAVATPAPSAPNRFALTPPASLAPATIPSANAVVHVTAGVTPLAGTGGTTPITTQTTVTFNSDICGVFTSYSINGPGPAIVYPAGDLPVDAAIRRDTPRGWFTERSSGSSRIAGERITEFTAGTTGRPSGIATGADGAMWYALYLSSAIGRMPLHGATAQTYAIPTPPANQEPQSVALGSDGAIWFTASGANQIGRIDTTGSVTEYSVPTAASDPNDIAAGPDGALWFTETCGDQIGRVDTTGAITEYSIPTASARPMGIAAGTDGAMWFGEYAGGGDGSGAFGRIPMTATPGSPQITEYSDEGAGPYHVAPGPDGNLWFVEGSTGNVAKVSTAGAILADYTTGGSGVMMTYITSGPDGALWFPLGNSQIARLTTGGSLTTFHISGVTAPAPNGITTGPDGSLWFTESSTSVNKIGRLQ